MAGERRTGTWSIVVDKDLRPAYYDRFRCLAGDCQLSCCEGWWRVDFDKKDYLSLKKQEVSPELRKAMDGAVRRVRGARVHTTGKYAEFRMPDGVCPLRREDGLCGLQAEKGAGALPAVCREFPRSGCNLISGYRERSLSPACEGVLALLWDLPEGVDFVSDPLPREKWRQLTMEGDVTLLRHYADIRELCIDFLQDRRFPLPRRMLMMGMALQELADGEEDVPGWLVRSRAMADSLVSDGFPEEPEQEKLLVMFLSNAIQMMQTFLKYDTKLDGIKKEILAYCGLSHDGGSHGALLTESYYKALERFEKNFGDRAYFFENLMVALLFKMHLPNPTSGETLWKSYVSLCNLYALYRFMAVMSCRDGAAGDRDELFRMIVYVSRSLIHDSVRRNVLLDRLFQNDSATLAHMAILLCG